MRNSLYLLSLTNTIFGIFCIYFGLYSSFALFLILIFLITAVADAARTSSAKRPISPSEHSNFLEGLLVIFPFLQWFFLILSIHRLSTEPKWMSFLLMALCVGLTNGAIGITYAHELIHRKGVKKQLGYFLLYSVAGAHFPSLHLKKHHTWGATYNDFSTSSKNQSLYDFLLRSFLGYLADFSKRMKKDSFHFKNRFGVFLISMLVLGSFLFLVWGIRGLIFYLFQSAVAMFLLETVNYIQHYGLTRKLSLQGRPESFSPAHAWEIDAPLSNFILLNLSLHADHHLSPSKPFYQLRPKPESPRLPFGYQMMVIIALIPPFWRKIMNPRLQDHERAQKVRPASQDLNLLNIESRREI